MTSSAHIFNNSSKTLPVYQYDINSVAKLDIFYFWLKDKSFRKIPLICFIWHHLTVIRVRKGYVHIKLLSILSDHIIIVDSNFGDDWKHYIFLTPKRHKPVHWGCISSRACKKVHVVNDNAMQRLSDRFLTYSFSR